MRNWTRIGWSLGLAVLAVGLAGGSVRAEDEEAPQDPTRGGWDSFLDPLRDAEDGLQEHVQKGIEDATKIHIGAGYTQAYTWSFNDPPAGTLAQHSLERHDEPTPTFAQLSVARPSEGWFIPGFGVKLVAGKVARAIKADWNGDGAADHGDTFETNNFDAEEAYVTWAVPDDSPALGGLSVKGGKFVTLLGAEVIEPWANYNYSRSFLFSLAIPFTHTGVLVSYPLSEKLSVTGGAVRGWDKVDNNNRGWSGLGNITYTATDTVTLAANGIWGPEQTGKTGPKRGTLDLVATIKPTAALTLLLNYDWGDEEHAALSGGTALWQGFAAVANYALTDRASVAARGEWFEDHGGSRTGLRQQLWEATLTGKYLLTQHFYSRVEYRHDESNANGVFPADNGRKALSGQDIVSVEFSYLFN
jgi:Putative beta-barrel porin-2, OmpL-like. bbp2